MSERIRSAIIQTEAQYPFRGKPGDQVRPAYARNDAETFLACVHSNPVTDGLPEAVGEGRHKRTICALCAMGNDGRLTRLQLHHIARRIDAECLY